jgi:hypothetical protein
MMYAHFEPNLGAEKDNFEKKIHFTLCGRSATSAFVMVVDC